MAQADFSHKGIAWMELGLVSQLHRDGCTVGSHMLQFGKGHFHSIRHKRDSYLP